MCGSPSPPLFFFFNDTATTEIYTLSLHDALPILASAPPNLGPAAAAAKAPKKALDLGGGLFGPEITDRKSTRLNSSHQIISYAVFCLKKKKPGCSAGLARPRRSPGADQAGRDR